MSFGQNLAGSRVFQEEEEHKIQVFMPEMGSKLGPDTST